jgi:hypothetical protein
MQEKHGEYVLKSHEKHVSGVFIDKVQALRNIDYKKRVCSIFHTNKTSLLFQNEVMQTLHITRYH